MIWRSSPRCSAIGFTASMICACGPGVAPMRPGLADVKGLGPISVARQKASVMSFVIDGHENEAVAHHLDARGIAVRSGHHCALPALRRFGVDQSVRASLAFYNTRADVDAFLKALHSLPRR